MATTTSIRFGTENYQLVGQVDAKNLAAALAGEHGNVIDLRIVESGAARALFITGAEFPIVIKQIETSSDAEGDDSTL